MKIYRKHIHPLIGPCGVCDAEIENREGCGCVLFMILFFAAIAVVLVLVEQ